MISYSGGDFVGNHIVRVFTPDDSFSRHSEGAFLRLKDGRILFIYSRFRGTSADNAPCDLVALFSSDEGETWTEPETVVEASRFGAKTAMSVSLMRMQNGDVGLFFGVKMEPNRNVKYLARSSDEGRTFSRFVECSLSDRPGYYVLNNDRVERLSNGRIIMPLTYHRGGYEPGNRSRYWDGRAFGCFLYSDDDGETWRESPDIVFAPFGGTTTGLQEGGVVEKKNGTLWGYYRTDHMLQYETFSMDEGLHWTAPQPSRFTSPPSPLKIKRRPETGDLYAVWNPIPNYNGRVTPPGVWGRTPLVWAVSHDDGVTWSDWKAIEDRPDRGYCYPAIFFTNDGYMMCAYCSGGGDIICLAQLTIQKIDLRS